MGKVFPAPAFPDRLGLRVLASIGDAAAHRALCGPSASIVARGPWSGSAQPGGLGARGDAVRLSRWSLRAELFMPVSGR